MLELLGVVADLLMNLGNFILSLKDREVDSDS